MMTRFLGATVLCCTTICTLPVHAGPYTSTIQNSINLNVQGTAIQTERLGSSLNITGTNVDTTVTGAGFGLGLGTAASATAPAIADNASTGSFKIENVGMPFSLNQSVMIGDTVSTTQTNASGVIAAPTLYGKSTTQLAGDAGTLAGTMNPLTGALSITAGGAGTSATASQTISLTAF